MSNTVREVQTNLETPHPALPKKDPKPWPWMLSGGTERAGRESYWSGILGYDRGPVLHLAHTNTEQPHATPGLHVLPPTSTTSPESSKSAPQLSLRRSRVLTSNALLLSFGLFHVCQEAFVAGLGFAELVAYFVQPLLQRRLHLPLGSLHGRKRRLSVACQAPRPI